MLTQPLVSIIIPTYNRAHLIGETLDSVLAQTYTNWECIVVDDGSTDATSELMKEYCTKDSRFHYHHRPEDRLPGGNAARNYGFEVSKGEYVNWLDSDDVLALNKIIAQVLVLLENKGEIATCEWGRFKEITNPNLKNNLSIYKDYGCGSDLIRDYGVFTEFFPSHVFLIKKSNLFRSGLWNENLKINQDGEFFCRLLTVSKNILFVKKTNVFYRSQLEGKTSTVSNSIKAEQLIISWMLIDQYLKLVDSKSFENYIQRGKNYCFIKLNKEYFHLIKNYKHFFRKQIQSRQLINRIKRKLF